MLKLDRLVADYPEVYRQIERGEVSKTYSCPKNYVTYRKPRKLNQKQREQAREQMKRINTYGI